MKKKKRNKGCFTRYFQNSFFISTKVALVGKTDAKVQPRGCNISLKHHVGKIRNGFSVQTPAIVVLL